MHMIAHVLCLPSQQAKRCEGRGSGTRCVCAPDWLQACTYTCTVHSDCAVDFDMYTHTVHLRIHVQCTCTQYHASGMASLTCLYSNTNYRVSASFLKCSPWNAPSCMECYFLEYLPGVPTSWSTLFQELG